MMDVADAEEYTASLGQIVAGSWRQIAWASRQGIPEALGLTTGEWVDQRLGGYVRLSISDRREAVAELTEEGMTQREVAEVLGVSQKTVDRDAESFDSDDEGADPANQGESVSPESFDSDDPSPPEPAPEVSPEELRRREEREATQAAQEARDANFRRLGQAVVALAAYADEPEVVSSLAAEYGPPGLPITADHINQAINALALLREEWPK